MQYYSTNQESPAVSFQEALMRGLAPDGGLYMPATIPSIKYPASSITRFHDVASMIAKEFIDIPEKALKKIIDDAFNPDAFPVGTGFPAPLVKLDDNLYILELFHGPTFSFKDFGARFMARVMEYYVSKKPFVSAQDKQKKLSIIVATSGDTGSAVAEAFHGLHNSNVFVLYPSKRISPLQEKQIATLGGNVTALEVEGDFDDCQRVAKQALADEELREKMMLSSANSINIGRLIPQSFYYAWASIYRRATSIDFIVPSGNFGNLTGALIAKRMGFPIGEIVAAVNKNYGQEKAVQTLSSAMDVAQPSNQARIKELGAEGVQSIRVSEEETRAAIRTAYKKYNYIADPHTAVGMAAEAIYRRRTSIDGPIVVVATAHPAKFPAIVEKEIGKKVPVPVSLQKVMQKEKKSIIIAPEYRALKSALLQKAGA